MIENMRKYTTLMVVVIVLLAAGLILTMNQSGAGRSSNSDFIYVNGISLDRNDFAKEGKNSVAALQSTGSAMLNFVATMTEADWIRLARGQLSTQDYLNFVTNRILLKQAAEELGVYPSPDAAQKYISDTMFIGRDGTFDQKLYNNFISNLEENLGLKESDFQNLVAEFIVFEKTRDLIGGGLTPSSIETITLNQLNSQEIGMEVVSFQLEDFKKDLQPTEEEIKAFWETHKDRYKTDRQLKVTYALALLDDSDMPQRPTPAIDADPEKAAQENIAYLTAQEEWETNRKQVSMILRSTFSDFIDAVDDSEGQDFDKAAKKAIETAGSDFVIVSTDFFSLTEAPDAIKNLKRKHTATEVTVAESLFAEKMSTKLDFNIHNYSVGRDGDIAIRIDEEKLPATKSYEDAKELATTDLINDLATKAMAAAAEEAKTKLTEATNEKAFTDAAKELDLTAKSLKPFTPQTAPVDEQNANEFYRIAQVSEPKTIANDIVTTADSATIVYVNSRTVEITGDETLRETQLVDQAANGMKFVAFNAWISGLKEAKSEEIKLPTVQ